MKITTIPMEAVAQSLEGASILRAAYENNSQTITQRLVPTNDEEDHDGGYLVMLLDWKDGSIVRIVLDGDELTKLTDTLKSLVGMNVLDGFATEGVTVQ